MYSLKLTFEELKILDGNVNEKAQKIIDIAKKENSYNLDNKILAEILRRSEEKGELNWMYIRREMRYCPNCGKQHGYVKYQRNTQYHSKGEENHNKPLYFSGIKFNSGFIRLVGDGDFCDECIEKINPIETLIKYILDNDLKIEIKHKFNDYETKYIKDDKRVCYNCKREMWESEMGDVPRLMGSGSYKGQCPHCSAKSNMFMNHKITHEWRMIKK